MSSHETLRVSLACPNKTQALYGKREVNYLLPQRSVVTCERKLILLQSINRVVEIPHSLFYDLISCDHYQAANIIQGKDYRCNNRNEYKTLRVIVVCATRRSCGSGHGRAHEHSRYHEIKSLGATTNKTIYPDLNAIQDATGSRRASSSDNEEQRRISIAPTKNSHAMKIELLSRVRRSGSHLRLHTYATCGRTTPNPSSPMKAAGRSRAALKIQVEAAVPNLHRRASSARHSISCHWYQVRRKMNWHAGMNITAGETIQELSSSPLMLVFVVAAWVIVRLTMSSSSLMLVFVVAASSSDLRCLHRHEHISYVKNKRREWKICLESERSSSVRAERDILGDVYVGLTSTARVVRSYVARVKCASTGTSRPECARENQWIQRPSRSQGQPRVDLDQEKISTSCGESGGPAFGHCVCESYAPTRPPGLRSSRLPSTGYSGTLGGRVECLLNHNIPGSCYC
ncbi:unnamed protein product [Trichogramma brassicae]|uniref:Uncharacterized protein n=1 Tax=Trichogramma brassicae TaxID=86971 RepID=A0A6H5J3C1_9HYME|nr:unnamed protein product [Trichogramma brassicae]